ncbi:serine acetyltransferase [Vibrio alginolyticus]|uniref:serine O-acetyltransferase n=1 Tax=Vibrio TaxID=662 RepID=UPI00146DC672|nr:serine acetyltransferase [Vibrio sp. 1167]MDW2301105.1 serine acetyltransferase [Vibrio sp. 1167]NMT95777.1 serine acetyltransferase [Vibrio alginolyticus]
MTNFIKIIFNFVFSTADNRVALYLKLICLCRKRNLVYISLIVTRRLQRKYGVFIGHKTDFDETLTLRHPTGIVIGMGATLGKNITIFQNVTIGRKNGEDYPVIGDNTVIYAGAVLVGDIEIGKNCVIGANSVVNKNIPSNSVVVGVPAKIIPSKAY